MEWNSKITIFNSTFTGLMDIAKHVIASMLSYVSLPTILQKLREVRDLILGKFRIHLKF